MTLDVTCSMALLAHKSVFPLWGAWQSSCSLPCSSTSLWRVVCRATQCCKAPHFICPLISIKWLCWTQVLITLVKFVTNKIWHLLHYIKPSLYCATSSLSRHSSVDEDFLSQGDGSKYLLKMAAMKVMHDTVTQCLHYTLLMFVFCFK